MSKSPQKLRRAGLAGLATTALVIGASAYGITTASADSTFAFDRVAGPTRFDTSVEAAKKYGNSTNVILANGTKGHYPDALTANYLSGIKNAPVLLTRKDSTPTVVSDYLKSSGVTSVTIIGGDDAVSAQQASDLTSAGYTVNRLQGATRFDTAKAVIGQGGSGHDTALLATGQGFADAVAAGPLSYASDLPLAITKTNSLPQSTADALKAAGVTQVIVVGGTNAVGDAVIGQLATNGITLKYRADGATRAETATKLAKYEVDNYGFSKTRVNVASGDNALEGADALSGGPVSGKAKRSLLITQTKDVAGDSLIHYLKQNASTLTGTDNHIFGDTSAVSAAVEQQLQDAGRNPNPTINKADLTTDAAPTGTVNMGDVVTLTFSEPVTQVGQTQNDPNKLALINLTDSKGDQIQVRCGYAGNPGPPSTGYNTKGDGITDATCTNGAAGSNSVTATLVEDPEVTNKTGPVTVTYPLTITAIQNVVDSDGNPVDLTDSADLKIG